VDTTVKASARECVVGKIFIYRQLVHDKQVRS
jgi:hypothetical protein